MSMSTCHADTCNVTRPYRPLFWRIWEHGSGGKGNWGKQERLREAGTALVPILTISHLGYAAAFCLALFGCCIPNPRLGLQPDWNHLSISLPKASHCLQTLFCSLSVIVLSYTHQQLISAPPVPWTVTLPPRLFRQHLRPLCQPPARHLPVVSPGWALTHFPCEALVPTTSARIPSPVPLTCHQML